MTDGQIEAIVKRVIEDSPGRWDLVAATPQAIEVPGWHRQIMDARLKDLETNPDAGDSWDAVQDRLRKKFD